MGLIIKTVEIVSTKKSQKFEALFDTGANGNYMNDEISADDIGFKVYSQTRVSIPGKRNTAMADT